ncbi:hypothetical protein DF3PB_830010 [uncultured Defluviicoccus sp.]|uniref:Uncharacterized protein n=1 Tax=metagenome TaxID=256318 RepID=A0A380TLZ4_9ZZZZ|nr:hypothetical protein DF3PB_830010 [uncultured Defluviicoccus sp.]
MTIRDLAREIAGEDLVADAGVLTALDAGRCRRVVVEGEPPHRLRPAHRSAPWEHE